MRPLAPKSPLVHAYGQAGGMGVWLECADCGLRRKGSSDTLLPCPGYSERTHARAGWLMLPLSQAVAEAS